MVTSLQQNPLKQAHVPGFFQTRFTPYTAPKEPPFILFLALSISVLGGSVRYLSQAIQGESPVKTISVEIAEIDGSINEPPPLGEPNAAPEAPQAESSAPKDPIPEPQPEPFQTPPEPVQQIEEPLAPPSTEPVPEVPQEPEPTKPEVPEFIASEAVAEKSSTPIEPPPAPREEIKKPETPKPPKPSAIAVRSEKPAAPNALSNQPAAGSPVGVPGGRGGSHGDFVATPHPAYDTVAQQRGYEGTGDVLITYQNGSITAVTMTRSTGVSYLDTKTKLWVKTRYRVKSGVSGQATFKITWALPR